VWNVLIATARGDKTIDRFDCSIGSLSSYIGKPGALGATIPIPNQQIGERCQAIRGRAGQLAGYVYYGADLWWGGLINATPIKGGRTGASMGIAGASFESYPGRREVRTDNQWIGVEQLEFPRIAWNAMQSTADGDLGVTVPAAGSSGVKRDLTVLRSEVRTWASVLNETSTRENGYEWMIDVYDDGSGKRYRELKTGYPTIGRARFDQVFTYPGNIIDYSIDDDALAGATSFQARGDSVGPVGPFPGQSSQQPLMSLAGAYDAADLLANGHLRFDATADRQGVKDQGTLDQWAGRDLALRSGAVPLIDIAVQLGGFNRSILGSTFQAQIDDFVFPRGANGAPGYVSRQRCIGYEVKPYERGSADEIKLIIESATD
jgi:hypothetical protein